MSDPKPIKPVSPRKYPGASPPAVAPEEQGSFPVRFRLKGHEDGPVYQGQKIVAPCKTCGKK